MSTYKTMQIANIIGVHPNTVCAGGLMGLPLVVADYRNKKILKRFKVTPVSPILILLVQVTIYTLYALVSLLLNFIVAALFFNFRITGSIVLFLGAFILVMLSMFSIGMMVGGIAPNIKTADVIASVLYFPMLIFSGATLPYETMPKVLQNFSDILPLTQGIYQAQQNFIWRFVTEVHIRFLAQNAFLAYYKVDKRVEIITAILFLFEIGWLLL